jgi:hypothetical protein
MPADLRSPRILQLSCGRVEIEALGTFKAAKLYPHGGRAWDWRETGTRQVLGIQPAESRSCWVTVPRWWCCRKRAGAPSGLARDARPARAQGHSRPRAADRAAVRLYNELAAAHKAGGVFRSTC